MQTITVSYIPVRMQRGVWQAVQYGTTDEYLGEESPYQYASKIKALDALKAMYPSNSVWQGHRMHGGWAILVIIMPTQCTFQDIVPGDES